MKSMQKSFIRKEIQIQDIQKCTLRNEWSFGNDILYDMCRKDPEHRNTDVILGKIWIIGRAYAAAIERRKNSNITDTGDNYFYKIVAPQMLYAGEELDKRILKLKEFDSINLDNLKEIIETHYFLTNVFSDISGLNKRSLASKYLHFHAPNVFYIYDSRAVQGARKYIMSDKTLVSKFEKYGDKDYINLVVKLFTFQEYVYNQHGLLLTPRSIDSFMLFNGVIR